MEVHPALIVPMQAGPSMCTGLTLLGVYSGEFAEHFKSV